LAKPTLVNTLERVHRRTGRYPHDCFRAFVRLVACAVATGRREEEYLQEAGPWKPEDLAEFSQAFHLMVEEMQTGEPFADHLGPIPMEWGGESGKKAGGEFYTPWALAEMMCQATLHATEVPKDRPFTVMEPACGSGIFVLAMAKVLQEQSVSPRRMRAVMYDVSPIAVDMALPQTTLWGIPALVVHGNTISGEEWARFPTFFWRTPREWLRPKEDVGQEVRLEVEEATPPPTAETEIPATFDVVASEPDERGQYEMDLFREAA